MLDMYCDLLFSPGTLSKDHIARVISTLVVQSTTHVDMDIHKLYEFFQQNLNRIIRKLDFTVEPVYSGPHWIIRTPV